MLRTGGGQPLVTLTEFLVVPVSPVTVPLEFDFGFATDETNAPGSIHDAFTVRVQDATGTHTLVLFTADAGGLVWLPPNPGGVLLWPNALVQTAIAFPSLQPVLDNQLAFAVSVRLPRVFFGPLHVYFDLFDNLDSTASLGWYRDVRIPEPAAGLLLLGGGMLIWLRRRRRR